MNVSSLSGSTLASYTNKTSSGSSGNADSQIKALEKQKTQIESQINKLDSSSGDKQTKEIQEKQLQQQLKQIEAQIAKLQQQQSTGTTSSSDSAGSVQVLSGAAVETATTDSEGHFDVRI